MPLTARAAATPLKASLDVEKAPLSKEELVHDDDKTRPRSGRGRPAWIDRYLVPGILLVWLLHATHLYEFPYPKPTTPPPPAFIAEGIKQCEIISRPPPHPKPFTSKRKTSDRFVPGTKGVVLKNGTVWTGEKDGEEVLKGASVYLEGGVIRKIGSAEEIMATKKDDAEVVELNGAWVTSGIVDMHSHMGVDPLPSLRGTADTNSLKAAVLPWLRSLDGFNTHDLAFNNSIAGGITTMLVLPGSAGNIGGQAFTFKPRWTYENTPGSMQVEPPFVIAPHSESNETWVRTGAWRHIKHACGENPARVYGNTRMDSAYDFRRAYLQGQKLKEEQDLWCSSPKTQTAPFPTSLEWEVLADAIRGNVKVNIHCYETTDLNSMVRISNEFKFPIAAFHHAHETYLVPDMLKQAYGAPPAIAIFATNARYKREAYRGSEFAPMILADAGLNVCMKSDHPVLDSRYLAYEAAQAHHYGLNSSQAIGSVTTHPAKAVGLDHRLGYIRPGYDADVVVWDSYPLALGATPKQTYIDGIPQILDPHVIHKPEEAQQETAPGEYDDQAAEALATRGDPDLRPKKSANNVIFYNVDAMYLPDRFDMSEVKEGRTVVVSNGEISCVGECVVPHSASFEVVDLKGGSITPGLITVGSFVGMMEIRQEKATWDGTAYDPLGDSPDLLDGLLVHGVDGVSFGSKDELLAYRSGVTTAVSIPISPSLFSGLSFAFSTSAPHPLAEGAILNPAAALHLSLTNSGRSVSTKIAILRRLLAGELEASNEITSVVTEVRRGERRLVVAVEKADVMAALVRLKRETAPGMRMTFIGAHESWMIASDLAREDIGVIIAPARSFPTSWDTRRIMPGPPLSNHTLASYLASHDVLVGLGINEEWQARNTRNDAAWIYADSPDVFSKQAALDLVSRNLEILLGLEDRETPSGSAGALRKGWVAWEGEWTGFGGRVRAVRGESGQGVDLF